MARQVRFGVQTAPQHTTWSQVLETWKLIDTLPYDTAWVFDHFYPIMSDPTGPCLEGWVSLAALASETSRVQAGVLVTGNTYRHPAVLANMGATLDHTSKGRLIMGLGAGWFEMEHSAYGIPYYTTAERIRRLDEAAEIIRRLWTQERTTYDGRYYRLRDALCEPKPLQKPYPPLMIGGAGEKLTLRVVARHADIWNTFGSPQVFRHKIEILRQHCADVGRNFDDIEVSWAGTAVLTRSESERDDVLRRNAEMTRRPVEEVEASMLAGSPDQMTSRIHEFIESGVTHFILLMPSPFNHETIRGFADKVIPKFH